jgi:hypothetical protein
MKVRTVFAGWLGAACLMMVHSAMAEIREDFSNGFPGKAGGGWEGPWTEKTLACRFTSVSAVPGPLEPSGSGSLRVEGESESAQACNASLSRQYGGDELALEGPVQYSFAVRLDRFSPDLRYAIFDASAAQVGTGANVTWLISAIGGFWTAFDGQGDDREAGEMPLGIPVREGIVYTVRVTAFPGQRKWEVELTDGLRTAVLRNLNFRSRAETLGGYLHYGFSDNKPATPSQFGFTLGTITMKPAEDTGSAH